jgi:hypothetical protein
MARMLMYAASMRMRYVVLVLSVMSLGSVAAAQSQCMWAHRFYGPDALSCQQGAQMKCVDGRWQPTGSQCADDPGDPTGEENQPGVVQPPIGND